jgi:hypothetical protein
LLTPSVDDSDVLFAGRILFGTFDRIAANAAAGPEWKPEIEYGGCRWSVGAGAAGV